jgi:hypothetical protein
MAVRPAPSLLLGAPGPVTDADPVPSAVAATRLSPLLTIGITVTLCLLALEGPARRYNDTASYFHLDLSGAGRLPAVPLLYSALSAGTLIVVVQAIAAGASWGWFAAEVQVLFTRSWSRVAAAVGIMIVGTSASISSWNGTLLSESLSLTLLAAIGAAAFVLVRRRSWSPAIVLCVLIGLWLLCRQQNVFLGLVAVALATPFVLWRGNRFTRRTLLAVAALCLLVVPLALRNEHVRTMNLAQLITARVLTDGSARAWWYDHGLPRRSCLEQHIGEFPECIEHDRVLRTWLERDGAATYAQWLVANPANTLLQPLEFGLAPQVQAGMQQERDVPALLFGSAPYATSRLDGVDVFAHPGLGQFLLVLTALGIAVQVVRRRPVTVAEVVAAATLLVALVWLYPSWLGAGFELVRVTVSSATLAKIGLVLGIVAVVDASWPSSRHPVEQPSAS